jgi:hypothetical protein
MRKICNKQVGLRGRLELLPLWSSEQLPELTIAKESKLKGCRAGNLVAQINFGEFWQCWQFWQ